MATRPLLQLRVYGIKYHKRPVELSPTVLDDRRRRFDIIKVFKIVHHINDTNMILLLTMLI